jgi:uncharacterized protein YcgL (UPF0745 family)
MTKSTESKGEFNNNLLTSKDYKNAFFKIFYNIDKHIYYLKDLGVGYGTFYKIEDVSEIKENTIVNIGENYLVFSFKIADPNNNNNNSNSNNSNDEIDEEGLYLKIYSNEGEYEPILIQNINRIYQIGRSEKCDIYIKDKMISRVHCRLFYIDNNWFIKDGNESGNESTNGTWVYANEETEITEGMQFKSNSCNFLCKFQ